MQPLLLDTKTTDEALLEKLNIACANEAERQKKKKTNVQHTNTVVHSVKSSDETTDKKPSVTSSAPKPSSSVLTELKELRTDVASLKTLSAEIAHIQESLQQPAFASPQGPVPTPRAFDREIVQCPVQPYWASPGANQTKVNTQFQPQYMPRQYYAPITRSQARKCFNCQQQRTEDRCMHCFRCGSSEHFQAGCRIRGIKPSRESLKRSKVQTFIHLVSAESSCEYIVKTTKVHVSIPKRSTVPVSCRVYMQPVKEDSTLIFEPDVNHQWPDGLEFTDSLVRLKKGAPTNITIEVYNDTDHDVTLMGQTPIGTLQFVKNVFPASMFEVPATPNSVGVCHIQTADNGHDNTSPDEWLPPVDVSHLDKHQRQVVQQMLREECHSFSKSDNDIGCIRNLQLSITLKDNEPVHRTYQSLCIVK
ncbi:NACHT, LRR and PYD domains-containing protein 12-like [Tachysurus ichikawai]